MIFHPKGKIIPNVEFFFNHNDLNSVNNPDLIYPIERIHNFSKPIPAIKMLGIYIDENLTFDYQIKFLTTKISSLSLLSIRLKTFYPVTRLNVYIMPLYTLTYFTAYTSS